MKRLMTTLIGILAIGAGIFGFIAPSYLLSFGRAASTSTVLYIVAVIRVGVGILLLSVARTSRLPNALRLLGALIVLAGILTPLFGTDRALAMLDWWSGRDALVLRVPFMVLTAAGVFIIYATRSRTRHSIS